MSLVLTRKRLNRAAYAILIGFGIALLIALSSSGERGLMIRQGDYPSFYSPAVIVSEGLEDRLFDQTLHQEIQSKVWPDSGAFYISVYPPYFSWMLQPLAWVSPHAGKLLLNLLMLAFHIMAVLVLIGLRPELKTYRFPVVIFSLAWMPALAGISAAQNNAISFLLVALFIAAFSRGNWGGDFRAGAILGLWLFKPQFAVIALTLLIPTKRWGVLAGLMLTGSILYLIGVHVSGWNWPFIWVKSAFAFGEINYGINAHQMVSIAGGVRAVSRAWSVPSETVLPLIANLLTALFLIFNIFFSLKHKVRYFQSLFPLAVAIIAPQTLFYDLGFCLSVFITGVSNKRFSIGYMASLLILSWVIFFVRDVGALSLYFFMALFIYGYGAWCLHRSGAHAHS